MIDDNEVPPKIAKSWQCDYCRYKENCDIQGDSKTLNSKIKCQ